MNEPSWIITALIGALLGYSIPYAVSILKYGFSHFKKHRVEGKWTVYHPTKKGNEYNIEISSFNIRKGLFHPFVVTEMRRLGTNKIVSKGTLHIERNYWFIKLQPIKYEEEVTIRVYDPIPTTDEVIWGLYMSLDFQGNPISGPLLISKKSISNDQILDTLSKKYYLDYEMKLVMVK